ncbi:translation elongation factor Ts [Sodalis sp. CWE]|uniref:translation elongation factor Ts n=1 Tax=Sodalis sp. CWE TaxID=2803816 RepID=UPI001C7CD9D8|nr:translation elongation factor Ts [Sodalis sp. CWE]MBX4180879.1 elongation factor Ts [Sodalis sp. CWE]
MSKITTALIVELRRRTGIGLLECKKALIKANGNIEIAIKEMRKTGKIEVAKKIKRITGEGAIFVKICKNKQHGVIIELDCETDFVVRNKNFNDFGNKVVNVALHDRITDVNTLRKVCAEQCSFLIRQVGENINIRRFGILEGDHIGFYLHNTRIGVIVSGSNISKELIKYIAMHIAASKPEYINKYDIPTEVFSREYQIQWSIAEQSKKSDGIINKIVDGRMRKFMEGISLIEQNFVMDQNKKVGQLLSEHNAKINDFIRFEVGGV